MDSYSSRDAPFLGYFSVFWLVFYLNKRWITWVKGFRGLKTGRLKVSAWFRAVPSWRWCLKFNEFLTYCCLWCKSNKIVSRVCFFHCNYVPGILFFSVLFLGIFSWSSHIQNYRLKSIHKVYWYIDPRGLCLKSKVRCSRFPWKFRSSAATLSEPTTLLVWSLLWFDKESQARFPWSSFLQSLNSSEAFQKEPGNTFFYRLLSRKQIILISKWNTFQPWNSWWTNGNVCST